MYYYSRKWTKLLLVGMLLSGTTLMADYLNLTGKIVKVKDNGEEEIFRNIGISVDKSNILTQASKTGKFSLKRSKKWLKYGDKIQLKLDDPNWFILSPFNGKIFMPNTAQYLTVRVISKQSRTYASLFTTVKDYSIQVLYTHNEIYAIDTMKALRKDNYKDVYSEAYAKASVPKNGFLYKVKVGHFKSKKKAIEALRKIRKRYRMWQDAFLTIHTQTIDD